MPFSVSAAGERDEVVAQLQATAGQVRPGAPDDKLKAALASLLAEHLGSTEMNHVNAGEISWRQVYVVEAEGHSGGGALNLELTVKALHVPAAAKPATAG